MFRFIFVIGGRKEKEVATPPGSQRTARWPGGIQKGPPHFGIGIQLGEIALKESVPSLRFVPEPPPKVIARGHFFSPVRKLEGFTLQPPRPHAIHEKPSPVNGLGWFVRVLDLNHFFRVRPGRLKMTGPYKFSPRRLQRNSRSPLR